MKPAIIILALIIAVMFVIVSMLSAEIDIQDKHIADQTRYIFELENCIDNIGEIQQKLIDQGFKDVVIDGEPNEVTVDFKWGPITERAYCNYMAVKSMNRMAKGKE